MALFIDNIRSALSDGLLLSLLQILITTVNFKPTPTSKESNGLSSMTFRPFL